MFKYQLEGHISYTSYRNLSYEQIKMIDAAQRPLPKYIVLPNGEKIDWNEAYRWSENRTKAGYAIVDHGIRIKYETKKSPDFDKPNVCGDC